MKKLTKRQQLAVAIAKDVIKQIRARKLNISNRGRYCQGRIDDCGIAPSEQVQKHLPLLRKHCEVCAKGAIFLSYIELKNKVTFGDGLESVGFGEVEVYFSESDVCNALTDTFTQENLDLIETAFEKIICGKDSLRDREPYDRACNFGRNYISASDRMIAICKNIIKNKGEFVP